MQIDQILSLSIFIAVMSGTPGPNNVLLMASGVNFGFRRTLPHVAGIVFGCQIMLLAAAAGLHQLLQVVPQAMLALRVFGVLFLMYMAWMLASAGGTSREGAQAARPIGFWKAALFQWANPKVWLMCAGMVAAWVEPARLVETTGYASLIFWILSVPLLLAWVAGGTLLQGWLNDVRRLTRFNRCMAALLLLSVVGMVQ